MSPRAPDAVSSPSMFSRVMKAWTVRRSCRQVSPIRAVNSWWAAPPSMMIPRQLSLTSRKRVFASA